VASRGNGLLGEWQNMNEVIHFDQLGLSAELFRIGGFAIRWYSLAYLVGILCGWWVLKRMVRKSSAPCTDPQIDDFIVWAAMGIMIGGRVGYLLFYAPAGYLDNPLAIFAVWKGGMAFHGGVLGVAIATAIFARMHKLSWLRLCDYVVCVYPFGHLLGRLANFVNAELWGRPTDGTWGIIFPLAGPEPRHPSQLYEAGLEGLLPMLILTWLFWRTDARLYPGRLAGIFFALMGAARFFVEFYREPDRDIGMLASGLTMGQTLTLPMILVGAVVVWMSGRWQGKPVA
jgi:phosphatidylglycerol---prolipoprotein diacylglyceryl transferase